MPALLSGAEFLEAARQQVEALEKLAKSSPEELSKHQRAAQACTARERQERIEAAARACTELHQNREENAQKPTEPRADLLAPLWDEDDVPRTTNYDID